MTNPVEQLRDKDQAVLQAIKNGYDDVQKITEHTLLENHEVNYSLKKLQELDLIQIEKQDGYTTRIINGQKRTFKTPKQAHLTEKAENLELDEADTEQYEDLTRRELIERIQDLENQVIELEKTFEVFKNQVTQKME